MKIANLSFNFIPHPSACILSEGMSLRDRAHSSEAAQSSAACQSHQERLCLIAHRVACSDSVAIGFTRYTQQEIIPNLARGLFNSLAQAFGLSAHRNGFKAHWKSESRSKLSHEFSILGRLAPAQVMIEVCYVKVEIREGGGQFAQPCEHIKQRYRIGAARYRNNHTARVFEHCMSRDEAFDSLEDFAHLQTEASHAVQQKAKAKRQEVERAFGAPLLAFCLFISAFLLPDVLPVPGLVEIRPEAEARGVLH